MEHSTLSKLVLILQLAVFIVVLIVSSSLFYFGWQTSFDSWLSPKMKANEVAIEKRAVARAKDRQEAQKNSIIDGIHVGSGMVYDENFDLVYRSCTSCHSAKLITQNKASQEGWIEMIRWMQRTQGLGDLGKNEVKIVSYLSKHYAPEVSGRRKNLNVDDIEWYILEEI